MDGGQPTGAKPCSWSRVVGSSARPRRLRTPSRPRERHAHADGPWHRPPHRASTNRCLKLVLPADADPTVGCARGRERRRTTPPHPEPGRARRQRRRVLRGRPRGRRGRRAHTPSGTRPSPIPERSHHRGVEQWQLVGLITQRSRVRIPPPLPQDPHLSDGGLRLSRTISRLAPSSRSRECVVTTWFRLDCVDQRPGIAPEPSSQHIRLAISPGTISICP